MKPYSISELRIIIIAMENCQADCLTRRGQFTNVAGTNDELQIIDDLIKGFKKQLRTALELRDRGAK